MTGGEPGGRGSGKHDQVLRILGDWWAPELAALLAPGTQLEEPLSGDLPASERRVDWLWRARSDGAPCALHVEFQLRGKEDMAHRMFVYASRIVAQYKLPPLGVLVYLMATKPLAQSPFVVEVPGKPILWYDFQVVRLWEVDPAPILTGELSGLLPIVPLMRGATPEQLPTLGERVLELPGMDAHQRSDMVNMLVGFGALRFPKVNVWEYLRRSTMLSELMEELVQDSPYLRQIRDEAAAKGLAEGLEQGLEQGIEQGLEQGIEQGIEQGRAEGIAKGRAEGRAEGLTKGRLQEAHATLRELGLARFPDLSAADLAVIDQITSLERLHALMRALMSMADAQTLREALGQAESEG